MFKHYISVQLQLCRNTLHLSDSPVLSALNYMQYKVPVPLHKSRPILQIFVIFFFHFISFFTRSVTTLSIQRRIKRFFSHFIWCNLAVEFKISSQRNSIPKLARFAAVIFYWFLHQIEQV